MKKFDPIRETNAKLAAAAAKAHKVKGSDVTSRHDVLSQIDACRRVFKALKITSAVTVKVGLWYKRTPVVDVIVHFHDLEPKTGEEAGEMCALMNEAYTTIRKILAQAIPGMTQFAPEQGVCLGAWRFQC